jgi:hypothetical protein
MMIAQRQLIHEIETLPADYLDEVFDFIGYLKTKPPVSLRVDARFRKEKVASTSHPISDSLLGIAKGAATDSDTLSLDDIRSERLAKYEYTP